MQIQIWQEKTTSIKSIMQIIIELTRVLRGIQMISLMPTCLRYIDIYTHRQREGAMHVAQKWK